MSHLHEWLDGMLAALFNLPGWVQLIVAVVWFYFLVFALYWQCRSLEGLFRGSDESKKREKS
jgi:hypothetical protein